MSLDFLQGPGKEFVESRAMERNGSGVSQILQWRYENGTAYTEGLFERVIHGAFQLNDHHSTPISETAYIIPDASAPAIATGTLPIPGTGLRRVAIRVRGVAAKIPTGIRTHQEGQAQHNRYGITFGLRLGISQGQIGGHSSRVDVTWLPDMRAIVSQEPPPIILASPVAVQFAEPWISLNTYDGVEPTDEAHKMDRIIYFSVNGAANISQRTTRGWISHGFSSLGDGVFIGGTGDGSGQLASPNPHAGLGTRLVGWVARNESGKNLTSLKPPHGLMFSNPINSVGLDVKIMGYHPDTQMRPVVYRELKAL